MNKHLISFLKFLLFLSIGLGILYWVYVSQQANYEAQCAIDGIPLEKCSLIDKLMTDFRQVKPFWMGMVVFCFMLSNVVRAIRWAMLIEPLGKKVKIYNTFMTLMFGYLVNYVVARTGEVAKCAALSRYEKVPADQVLGTVVVSRSLDVICLLGMIGLAFLLNFNILWNYVSEHVFSKIENLLAQSWLWGLAIIFFISLGLAWIKRKELLKSKIVQKIVDIILGFWKGIKTIGQLKRPGLFVFYTLFIWFLYYMMHYVAFFAYQPTEHLLPADGLTMFVFGSLGIVIPTPGGLGSYQYLVTTALTEFYAISPVEAFTFSMIVFFPPFICNIVFGFISLVLLPIVNRKTDES